MHRHHMFAELGHGLTQDYVSKESADFLRFRIKSWLERENPRCLKHPLGFYVVLIGRTEKEEWRFHFWPKGLRCFVGLPARVHTHDRCVWSRVLQGELTNIVYDVIPVQLGGQPLYKVDYGGDRYVSTTSNSLLNTGKRVQTIVQQAEIVVCGDSYDVGCHTFHEALVSEKVDTATLVCMHSHSPGDVMVVGVDGYPEAITFTRVEHEAREFADCLAGRRANQCATSS